MVKRSRKTDARSREATRRAAERAARGAGSPTPEIVAPRAVAGLTRGNNRWDALAQVEEAARLERSVRARKDRAVRRARAAGATWTDLAKLLEVSPQAVQQKYGAPPSQDP